MKTSPSLTMSTRHYLQQLHWTWKEKCRSGLQDFQELLRLVWTQCRGCALSLVFASELKRGKVRCLSSKMLYVVTFIMSISRWRHYLDENRKAYSFNFQLAWASFPFPTVARPWGVHRETATCSEPGQEEDPGGCDGWSGKGEVDSQPNPI